MAVGCCCNGAESRSESPDPPNAREPIIPVQQRHIVTTSRPMTPTHAFSSAFAPNVTFELQRIYPTPIPDNILLDPRTLVDVHSMDASTPHRREGSSKLMTVIKRRLSREPSAMTRGSSKLSRKIRVAEEGSNDETLGDGWLEIRSPSRGGYDTDARLLLSPSLIHFWDNSSEVLPRGNVDLVSRRSSPKLKNIEHLGPIQQEEYCTTMLRNVTAQGHDNRYISVEPPLKSNNIATSASLSTAPMNSNLRATSEISYKYGHGDRAQNASNFRQQPYEKASQSSKFSGGGQGMSIVNVDARLIDVPGRTRLTHGKRTGQFVSSDLATTMALPTGYDSGLVRLETNASARNCDRDDDENGLSIISALPRLAYSGVDISHPATIGNLEGSEFASSDSSLHLYNMRISQHLRSLSSLSNGSTVALPSQLPISRALAKSSNTWAQEENVEVHWKTGLGLRGNAITLEDNLNRQGKADGQPQLHQLSIAQSRALYAQDDMGVDDVSPMVNAYSYDNSSGYGSIEALSRFPIAVTAPRMNRKMVASFDGSADPHLALPLSKSPRPSVSSRRESVAENYDEAAVLWGKALTAHQNHELTPNRSRASSFLSTRRSSQRTSSIAHGASHDAGTEVVENACRRDSATVSRIEFRPLNAEHSFDRLTLRGRGSVSEAHSPFGQPSDNFKASGRHRAHSHGQDDVPPWAVHHAPTIQVPGIHSCNEVSVPDITLSEPQALLKPSSRSLLHRYSTRSLKAWARYPSHTRDERNMSAGQIDNVQARDFAPLMINTDEDNGESQTQTEGLEKREKQKKQKRNAKSKSRIWRAKLLTTWPSRFVSRNTGFRQREHGHRTSISAGGTLEYPELELLSAGEARLEPTWNESSPLAPSTSRASLFALSGRHPNVGERMHHRVTSNVGSSEYGTPLAGSPAGSEAGSTRRPPGAWVTDYSEYHFTGPTRQTTELVSPLDGTFHPLNPSRLHSPSVMSLPLTLRQRAVTRPPLARGRTVSAEELRRSTQDLRRMLDMAETEDVAKALRAAEVVWERVG